jgi:hypothetical protein
MIKIKYLVVLLIFITTNSFGVYTYSLTRMDMITPQINSTVTSEMSTIINDYKEIEKLFSQKINIEIEKKNSLNKLILQEKAIGNTLLKEVRQLNNDIESILYLKGKIK